MATINPILRFINAPNGTIEVADTGMSLHWDISQEGVSWLKGKEGSRVYASDDEAKDVRDLWFAIRQLTDAFVDSKTYSEAELELLNSWATRPSPVPILGVTGLVYPCPSFPTALAWVAGQVVYLLGRTKHGHIRKCQNCATFIFDDSPTGRRKWCSMSKCGNRVKARSRYAKLKAPSPST